MKKIVKALLMLTCVFSLTACGSDNTISEFQQSKIDAAEAKAPQIIALTAGLVQNNDIDELTTNYNNIELGDLYTSTYSQYAGDSSFSCEGKGIKSALTSFESGMEEIGNITVSEAIEATVVVLAVELLNTAIEATVDDDTIIVTVPVTGEKGEGSVELIFTNDIYLTLTSCTLNLNKSMGELMGKAALNTLIGMGTVFVVLILISLIISCFSFIPKLQEKFSKKAAPAPAAAPVPAAPVVEEEELADDTELVAVIAAAIAAYEGTSTDGFQVRSIKRASTRKWKNA